MAGRARWGVDAPHAGVRHQRRPGRWPHPVRAGRRSAVDHRRVPPARRHVPAPGSVAARHSRRLCAVRPPVVAPGTAARRSGRCAVRGAAGRRRAGCAPPAAAGAGVVGPGAAGGRRRHRPGRRPAHRPAGPARLRPRGADRSTGARDGRPDRAGGGPSGAPVRHRQRCRGRRCSRQCRSHRFRRCSPFRPDHEEMNAVTALHRADDDCRLAPPDWQPTARLGWPERAARVLALVNVFLAVRYLVWLLAPGRAAALPLYLLLVGAEAYNMIQGAGFWWTVWKLRPPTPLRRVTDWVAVDVLIPVYNEPPEIVEPTVAAAVAIRSAAVRVAVLDDGGSPEIEEIAHRYGARYIHRPHRDGAKAGNVNYALDRTDAPFVAILDCDHVPDPRFLEETLGAFDDPEVAFVQTPQYYANASAGPVAAASWAQQSLFFGSIAVARDAMGAMFCCGTNVVFRRKALRSVGGFPTHSLTEDFELSIQLHED